MGKNIASRQIGQLMFGDLCPAPPTRRGESLKFNKVAKPESATLFTALYFDLSTPTVWTKLLEIVGRLKHAIVQWQCHAGAQVGIVHVFVFHSFIVQVYPSLCNELPQGGEVNNGKVVERHEVFHCT